MNMVEKLYEQLRFHEDQIDKWNKFYDQQDPIRKKGIRQNKKTIEDIKHKIRKYPPFEIKPYKNEKDD